jgi:hypothetical protein
MLRVGQGIRIRVKDIGIPEVLKPGKAGEQAVNIPLQGPGFEQSIRIEVIDGKVGQIQE